MKQVKTTKFMQTLSLEQWKELRHLAKRRGTTVQDYIRIIVIPEHLYVASALETRKPIRGSK